MSKNLAEQLKEIVQGSKVLCEEDTFDESQSLGMIDKLVESETDAYVEGYLNSIFNESKEEK